MTSEGIADAGIDPFVREYCRDGTVIRDLPLPQASRPSPDGSRGVRQNLGFESAAVTAHGPFLVTGTSRA